jgi:hypothetical protein
MSDLGTADWAIAQNLQTLVIRQGDLAASTLAAAVLQGHAARGQAVTADDAMRVYLEIRSKLYRKD